MYGNSLFLTGGASELSIKDALLNATELFNWVMDCITSNPIMTTAFVVTVLVPAGIMVFHRLKGTV